MKNHIAKMLRSVEWANAQVLARLRIVSQRPEVTGQGAEAVSNALAILSHIVAAEHIWLSRIEGRETEHPVWPSFTLEVCERIGAENTSGFLNLLNRLPEADLSRRIHYRNTKGQDFATPILDILTHVVIHGAYHRGQIARIVGQSGDPAPNTDFITFVRDVESKFD